MVYWNIFWRTFAQLAAAALIAVFGTDLVVDIKTQGMGVLLALVSAAVGGLAAVLWAFIRTPATTPLEKAMRSAAEKLVGVLAAIPVNAAADLVAMPRLILVGLAAVIASFVITYFQNQGPAQEPVASGTAGT